jgi:hypothetical protein
MAAYSSYGSAAVLRLFRFRPPVMSSNPTRHRLCGRLIVSPREGELWPQLGIRTIGELQPSAFRLFGRSFKPFAPPDASHPMRFGLFERGWPLVQQARRFERPSR